MPHKLISPVCNFTKQKNKLNSETTIMIVKNKFKKKKRKAINSMTPSAIKGIFKLNKKQILI